MSEKAAIDELKAILKNLQNPDIQLDAENFYELYGIVMSINNSNEPKILELLLKIALELAEQIPGILDEEESKDFTKYIFETLIHLIDIQLFSKTPDYSVTHIIITALKDLDEPYYFKNLDNEQQQILLQIIFEQITPVLSTQDLDPYILSDTVSMFGHLAHSDNFSFLNNEQQLLLLNIISEQIIPKNLDPVVLSDIATMLEDLSHTDNFKYLNDKQQQLLLYIIFEQITPIIIPILTIPNLDSHVLSNIIASIKYLIDSDNLNIFYDEQQQQQLLNTIYEQITFMLSNPNLDISVLSHAMALLGNLISPSNYFYNLNNEQQQQLIHIIFKKIINILPILSTQDLDSCVLSRFVNVLANLSCKDNFLFFDNEEKKLLLQIIFEQTTFMLSTQNFDPDFLSCIDNTVEILSHQGNYFQNLDNEQQQQLLNIISKQITIISSIDDLDPDFLSNAISTLGSLAYFENFKELDNQQQQLLLQIVFKQIFPILSTQNIHLNILYEIVYILGNLTYFENFKELNNQQQQLLLQTIFEQITLMLETIDLNHDLLSNIKIMFKNLLNTSNKFQLFAFINELPELCNSIAQTLTFFYKLAESNNSNCVMKIIAQLEKINNQIEQLSEPQPQLSNEYSNDYL